MLWFGRRYSLVESGLLDGCEELHSHLLPGVDDGVSSVEESLEILSEFERMGYSKVTITPHLATRFIDNTAASLRTAFEEFKAQYKGSMELALGAEYRLDDNFPKFAKSGDWLLVNDRWLLIESYLNQESMFLDRSIYELQLSGLELMLAHPERYLYMKDGYYDRLRDKMVTQQLDLFSLLGHYGSKVERRAKSLLERGHYDTMGSDIHSAKQLKYFNEKKISSKHIDLLFDLR